MFNKVAAVFNWKKWKKKFHELYAKFFLNKNELWFKINEKFLFLCNKEKKGNYLKIKITFSNRFNKNSFN